MLSGLLACIQVNIYWIMETNIFSHEISHGEKQIPRAKKMCCKKQTNTKIWPINSQVGQVCRKSQTEEKLSLTQQEHFEMSVFLIYP